MADAPQTKASPAEKPVAVQPQVLVTGEQLAREQLAAEMADLAKQPLDRHPIAGGVFEDAPNAGTFHDAEGRPVTKDGKPVKA